jgi:ferric-dicitrate binding protein FerR (iron transport regulator)
MEGWKRLGARFFAVSAGVLGLAFAPVPARGQEAYFREVEGTVEAMAPGSGVWVKAAAGDRIGRDAVISTGFRSYAVVVLGESVITVRPVTRLSLEEMARDGSGEQVGLYLQTGRIRAEVNPPAGARTVFTVRSPIATASVRGTSFEFDTERLRVAEGRVDYSIANGRQVSVGSQETSYVGDGGEALVSPFQAAEEQFTPPLPTEAGAPAGDSAPLIPEPGNSGIEFRWD